MNSFRINSSIMTHYKIISIIAAIVVVILFAVTNVVFGFPSIPIWAYIIGGAIVLHGMILLWYLK